MSNAADHAGLVLAEGLGFTEGPALLPDGSILFTSIAGTLHAVEDDRVSVAAETGFGPTGLAVGADDTVFIAGCSGLFGAPADRPAGVHRRSGGLLETFLSEGLQAPNDICFGPDGRLYFTDPGSDERALFEQAIPGVVYAYDFGRVALEAQDRTGLFPNGLAFDPSGQILYVSESFSKRIVRYRLDGGSLTDKTTLIELESTPDGMALDSGGNIWQCVNPLDAILVVSPGGDIIRRFSTGEGSYPSNCCFGGPDLSQLYVTTAGRGGLTVFEPGVQGLPLYPFR